MYHGVNHSVVAFILPTTLTRTFHPPGLDIPIPTQHGVTVVRPVKANLSFAGIENAAQLM